MRELRWGPFGEVAVQRMAQVKPGENLLILADTWTDMEIAEACLVAGINAKANAQLLVIPRMSRTDMSEFNPSTEGAILGADVILGLCEVTYIYKAAGRKARDKGIRIATTVPKGVEDYVIEGILEVDHSISESRDLYYDNGKLCRVSRTMKGHHRLQQPPRVDDGQSRQPINL